MATKDAAQYQRYLRLDPAAAQLLDELAPSPGRRGRYISNLILMEYARQEERRRLRQALAPASLPDALEQSTDGQN